MDKNTCAEPFQIVDGLDLIKKQRKRLEGIIAGKEFKQNTQWSWMLDWINKTDEQHLQQSMTIDEFGSIESNFCCAICFKPKRFLLATSFSFCNEYGCGMNICKECATQIGKLAKKMPKEA